MASRTFSTTRPHFGHQSTDLGQPIIPDAVGEDVARVYEDLSTPRHEQDATLFEESSPDLHDAEIDKRRFLPWWKRPSYWWILVSLPISSIVLSTTIAPRVEIYTSLVCATHKPDLFDKAFPMNKQWKIGFQVPRPDNHDPVLPPHPIDDVIVFSQGNSSTPHENLCATDPDVVAKTAELNAILTTTMGVLSCITTASWGAVSDRYGRVRVMGIAITGLLLTDLNFILVVWFFRSLPGGYWFLLITSIYDGLVGGLACSVATFHSYLADTTTLVNRSRVFSTTIGFFFVGMSAGPALGSLVIKATGRTINVFYFASACHIVFAMGTWFLLPESLSQARMQVERRKHSEAQAERARQRKSASRSGKLWLTTLSLFGFLSVLGDVFSPVVSAAEQKRKLVHRSKLRDWNLPLLAIAYGFVVTLIGAYPFKIQFAALEFDWDATMFGYWLSLVSGARAISLIVLLPLVIRFLKPKPIMVPASGHSEEQELLLADDHSDQHKKPDVTETYVPTFELWLCRFSMLVELVSYTLIVMTDDPVSFTVLSMAGALSAAFGPAMQTVALHLHVSRTGSQTDTGKLFGALSVVQALCSQIIGPSLFGLVFAKSVRAGHSKGIFILCVACIAMTFLLLLFVRVQAPPAIALLDDEERDGDGRVSPVGDGSQSHRQDETLVDV